MSWSWLADEIGRALAAVSPSARQKRLAAMGKPLAVVLTAVAEAKADALREEAVCFLTNQPDLVLACLLPALRAGAKPSSGVRRDAGFDDLAADGVARLRVRLDVPRRAGDDWAIALPDGCGCELCDSLGAFLSDSARRHHEWPIAEQRRRHVHARIDAAELPVTHQTRRRGRLEVPGLARPGRTRFLGVGVSRLRRRWVSSWSRWNSA